MTGLSFTTVQILYLLCAAVLTVGADALTVHWLGKTPWNKAIRIGLLALIPFVVVVAGFFILLATPFYKSQIEWTMTFGLPLLVFFGLLWLAWVVKIVYLCIASGTKAGLIAGLVVFPILWSGILTGKGLLWNALDSLREPTTLETAWVVKKHAENLNPAIGRAVIFMEVDSVPSRSQLLGEQNHGLFTQRNSEFLPEEAFEVNLPWPNDEAGKKEDPGVSDNQNEKKRPVHVNV